MSRVVSCGWRAIAPPGREAPDPLGFDPPIAMLLDYCTPGITNATRRARYLTLVPWMLHRHARRAGDKSSRSHRRVVHGLERVVAYANLALEAKTGRSVEALIRRRECSRAWKNPGIVELPLRGPGFGRTPSPLDAPQYGPALRRLQLTHRIDRLHVCAEWGRRMAAIFGKEASLTSEEIRAISSRTVARPLIERVATRFALGEMSSGERVGVTKLLLGEAPFASTEAERRARSLALILRIVGASRRPATERSIERTLASGLAGLDRTALVPPGLERTARLWQTISLLKTLRRAGERALRAVHDEVANRPASDIESALSSLVARLVARLAKGGIDALNDPLERLVPIRRGRPAFPRAPREFECPEEYLAHALSLLGWVVAVAGSPLGLSLLKQDLATAGRARGASLRDTVDPLSDMKGSPIVAIAHWLVQERTLARHDAEAARRGRFRYRVLVDELGVEARGRCPLAAVAIRVGAILSLLRDIKLIRDRGGGFVLTRRGRVKAEGLGQRFANAEPGP